MLRTVPCPLVPVAALHTDLKTKTRFPNPLLLCFILTKKAVSVKKIAIFYQPGRLRLYSDFIPGDESFSPQRGAHTPSPGQMPWKRRGDRRGGFRPVGPEYTHGTHFKPGRCPGLGELMGPRPNRNKAWPSAGFEQKTQRAAFRRPVVKSLFIFRFLFV